MEYTFNEKMVIKMLQDNLIFDIAGLEIEIENEGLEQSKLDDYMKPENLAATAHEYMLDAFKMGHFKSHRSNAIIEAKHLKFSGKEKLDMIELMAAAGTLGECQRG